MPDRKTLSFASSADVFHIGLMPGAHNNERDREPCWLADEKVVHDQS